jgi:hypothetical protein
MQIMIALVAFSPDVLGAIFDRLVGTFSSVSHMIPKKRFFLYRYASVNE